MIIKPYKNTFPRIEASAFIAETAVVIGDVTIGRDASVWYGVTIRGDINSVHIGEASNLQEQCVVHVDSPVPGSEKGKTLIGAHVTIGHGAIIHACEIEDDCLIGMGAIILSGAKIGRGSIVAAGSVVREHQQVPPGSLVAGIPAAVKSALPPEKIEQIRASARHYVEIAAAHRQGS